MEDANKIGGGRGENADSRSLREESEGGRVTAQQLRGGSQNFMKVRTF